MASEHDAISFQQIDLNDLLPLLRRLAVVIEGADRTQASAACLITYFILVAPRPMSKQELATLMTEGSAVLIPLLIAAITNAGDYVPLHAPTHES